MDDVTVFIGNEIRKNRGAGGRAYAARQKIVFDRYRNAAEGACSVALAKLLFRSSCFRASVIGDDGNERIESRVELFDARERYFHEIGRRDISFAEQACGLFDGKESQVGF